MRVVITTAMLAQVVSEYKKDYSLTRVAELFGVNPDTIRRAVDIVLDMERELQAQYNQDNTFNFAICSVFGCGKHLTTQEQLFGNTCINHQVRNNIDPTLYLSF